MRSPPTYPIPARGVRQERLGSPGKGCTAPPHFDARDGHPPNASVARSRARQFCQDIERGDYLHAFTWLASHEVADGLVYLAQVASATDEDLRRVVLGEWWRCDAPGRRCAELLELFHRVAPVSDTGRQFAGTLAIYRGNLGEDPRLGVSWTLSKAKARWFALYPLSLRGRFLGLRRPDGGEPVPTVWAAEVAGEDVLGYFGGRRESEVVIDGATVRTVTAVLRPRLPRARDVFPGESDVESP